MQLKETQAALRAFGKYVVQQARTNLTKGSGENKKYGTKMYLKSCTILLHMT